MACCKDCSIRHPKCHAECELYLSEREERMKAAAKRLEEARLTETIITHKPKERP